MELESTTALEVTAPRTEIDAQGELNLQAGSEVNVNAPKTKANGKLEVVKDLFAKAKANLARNLVVKC